MILPSLQSILKSGDEEETPKPAAAAPQATALDTVIQEAQPQNIISRFEIKTAAGKEAFLAGLRRFSSSAGQMTERANRFAAFRAVYDADPALKQQTADFYDAWSAAEETITDITTPPSKESEESIGQIIFTGSWLTCLNHIPFLLTVLLFMKLWITPIISFALPLMFVVLPYVILRYVFMTPITVDQYWQMFQKMVLGNIMAPADNIGGMLHKVVQVGGFMFSLGQTMIQPYLTARHVGKIDTIFCEKMDRLQSLLDAWFAMTARLKTHGIVINDRSLSRWLHSSSIRGQLKGRNLLAALYENKTLLKMWIRSVGDVEVMYRFATASPAHICPALPVRSAHGQTPSIQIVGGYDPQVEPQKRRTISLSLGGASSPQHALLTGPNRGGKSTALRCVLLNVLLAQTYGIGLAERLTLTPLGWIHSCLRLEDIPGSTSFFEREVQMAAMSLRRMETRQPGIVLVDELFHSTNPPDSHKAASIYTAQLWSSPTCLSMISTHDFSLVKEAPRSIERLCVEADLEGEKVIYKYGLVKGVCYVSSVYDILLEKGLVSKII
jgi:hypothetical protein